MTTLEFTLPYPPSVNRYYRHVGPRTLISREGREYRKAVCSLLGRVKEPLTGLLEVEIDLFPPDRRRRDIDNAMKGLLDSMQAAGVYEDDSQIVHLDVWKRSSVRGGRADVRVSAL